MSSPKRFQARRHGADGAVIRDNATGRTVATFPSDPDIQGMARRYADAAAEEFNRLHEEHLANRKKRGW
ncbi:MAG: hypothetical protein AB7E51_06730 [Pseudodesulfovibrio sp.]|uniref:hypothetical protein n=1 Tax=Pseudodesulfovibrio sp. TaxID=2035812 RepID=UPI003D0E0AD1